ncbi:MAG: DedA family protein [Haloplanus sp.]
MFEGLLHAVLQFVVRYGYAAVFVYMVLETSFLLHYVPSEVVVPFAASQLVHGPLSFVVFVADTTAGATLGSLLAYVLFGRYGREAIERYGRLVHVSERSLDRSEAVFARYGESSVFWGRMLPFVRAFISIPAGLAGMDRRRFLAYSAAGALLFDTALTYLVYTGAESASPLELFLRRARTEVGRDLGYVSTHPRFVVVVVGALVVVAAGLWVSRAWIRSNPATAKLLALHLVRIVGLFVGGVFVLGALASPTRAFGAITAVWNDPLFWVGLGFSEQVALLLEGTVIVFAALFVYEVGQLVELAHVRSVFARLR